MKQAWGSRTGGQRGCVFQTFGAGSRPASAARHNAGSEPAGHVAFAAGSHGLGFPNGSVAPSRWCGPHSCITVLENPRCFPSPLHTCAPCLPQQLPQGWGAQHTPTARSLLAGPAPLAGPRGWMRDTGAQHVRAGTLQPPQPSVFAWGPLTWEGLVPLGGLLEAAPCTPSVHSAAMGHARSLCLAHSCEALPGSAGLGSAIRSSPRLGRKRKRRRRRHLCR